MNDSQAADEAILVLAPMLLLMNQDPLAFRSLKDRRRYAPLVLGLTACLTFSAVTGAFQKAGTAIERSPFVVEQQQPSGMLLLIKNLALLALALPNHIFFLRVGLGSSSFLMLRQCKPCSVLVLGAEAVLPSAR